MSFDTTLHFLRPSRPPRITGPALGGFVSRLAALHLTSPGRDADVSVSFGSRIDQDRKPTIQMQSLSSQISTLSQIDWDVNERRIDLAEACAILAGDSRGIYRAHVCLGNLRDDIAARLSRVNSPENSVDLHFGQLVITIEPILLQCLGSMRSAYAGWISLNLSGSGYLWPWTLSELIARAESVAGIRRAMDVCRETFPVAARRPWWWERRRRRSCTAFWPCADLHALPDWSWGVDEG
jgi:hypothetical protein